MKITKSQTGFTPLHALLLLVLLGIIGFTGWKVYDAGKSAETTSSNTVTPAANQAQQQPPVSTIPEGFVEYKNDALGFKFAYPKEWGAASTQVSFEGGHAKTGDEYLIKFSSNDKITAAVRSKDYVHDPEKGHGGFYNGATGLLEYKKFVPAGTATSYPYEVFKNDDNSYLIAGVTCTNHSGCNAAAELLLVRKLEQNTKYAALTLLFLKSIEPDPVGDNFETLKNVQWQSHIPESLADEFKKVDSSISTDL